MSNAQTPLNAPVEKSSELLSSANTLVQQAILLSGPARLTKLHKAQPKLEAALKIDPNNALVLFALGNMLRLQATFFSGLARSTKLNEAQSKLEAALAIQPNKAFASHSLRDVLKAKKNLRLKPEEAAS